MKSRRKHETRCIEDGRDPLVVSSVRHESRPRGRPWSLFIPGCSPGRESVAPVRLLAPVAFSLCNL